MPKRDDFARREALRGLMDHLDWAVRTGSEEVKELISVSFVENLIGETVALGALRPLMGASLQAAVDMVCGE